MMWVRLNCNKNIVVRGQMIHYKKGDWVSVGRQIAQEWVAGGEASQLDPEQLADTVNPTAGIVVRGVLSEEWRDRFKQVSGLQFAFFEDKHWVPQLPFTETLIWRPKFDLRLDLLLTGFELLKKFQVVAPLMDYTTLAQHLGSERDRELTRDVIRDLRVPVYDTRLIYVKRCDDTRNMAVLWGNALETCHDERLAFLQALYMVKPLICPVPASWVGVR